MLQTTDGILQLVGLLLVEIVGLIAVMVIGYLLIRWLLSRIARSAASPAVGERLATIRLRIRGTIIAVTTIAIIALLCWNGYLVWDGQNALTVTLATLQEIPRDAWIDLGWAVGQVILAAIAAGVVNRNQRRLLAWLEQKVNDWDQSPGNDASLKAFCASLSHVLANTAWLLVLWFAFTRLPLPESFEAVLLRGITIYLTIALGLLLVRINAVVVDTVDAISHRWAENKQWYGYYQHLRSLVPLLRRCLECALWVGVATLVIDQLGFVVARWGWSLITAIGIFFVGRVLIEFGFLVIDNAMTTAATVDETERRRRDTIKPLVKSVFKFISYFAIVVLMLAALDFDVLPLLAGAGIIGMVIGLGAQPLINDIMSGFFILFENIYMRGDFIETGGARGTVEAIDFRTTKIRDIHGNLRILRNGDLREVINFSKEYTAAVVDVTVPYQADARQVFDELRAAATTLGEENDDILGETEVRGIIDFDDDGMVIRTVTRVRPTCHASAAAHFRLLIKDRFDAAGITIAGERLAVTLAGEAPGLQPT